MTDCLHLRIHGEPVPQGSVSSFNGRVVGVTAKLRKWRDAVRAASIERWGATAPFDGPVAVSALFILKAPQKPRWPVPAVTPDLDKLARAVGDALTHTKDKPGILVNDSRIVAWHVSKAYGDNPGVLISIDFHPASSQLTGNQLT